MAKKTLKLNFKIIALLFVILVIGVVAYYALSVDNISDVKTEENIGKNVRVKGEVSGVIKIGSLSGYTLEDDSGSIAVSSEALPKEGDTITVKGTLIRDTIFGYYIKVD